MYIDPIVLDFLVKFVLPIFLSGMFMFGFGAQIRLINRMLRAVIGELVHLKVFDADSLVRIGLLDPPPDPTNPVELFKLLRGA